MVNALFTHLRLTNIRFCIFYVEMKHFEAYVMVLSRVVDSEVLRMVIQFDNIYFFLIRRQNEENHVVLEIMMVSLWYES